MIYINISARINHAHLTESRFFFRASLVISERDVIQMQFIEEEYQRELVKHGKEKALKLISNPVKIRRKIRK